MRSEAPGRRQSPRSPWKPPAPRPRPASRYDAGRMIAHGHTSTPAALAAVLLSRAAAMPPPRPCTVVVSDAQDLPQAIARVPAGAVVCLAAGEFRLRRFLAIDRDDLTLRGAGPATVLRLEEGSESPVVVIGDVAHATPPRATANVTVEHLRIVGGGRGGSEVEPAHPYLTNSAIVVRRGHHVRIRHVAVTACRSACILTERDSRDVTIEHNRIRDAVWDGISLNRTAKARVLHNRIRDCTAAGITTEHLESSLIAENVLRANRTHGIYLSDSVRNRIVGNRFVGNVLSGVFLTCAVEPREPLRAEHLRAEPCGVHGRPQPRGRLPREGLRAQPLPWRPFLAQLAAGARRHARGGMPNVRRRSASPRKQQRPAQGEPLRDGTKGHYSVGHDGEHEQPRGTPPGHGGPEAEADPLARSHRAHLHLLDESGRCRPVGREVEGQHRGSRAAHAEVAHREAPFEPTRRC